MALPTEDAISVGVFGADPIVGRALEQVLRSAGYAARFLNEASLDKAQTLDGLELMLFAGGFDARRREASMALLKGALKEANLPVLELVSSLVGAEDGSPGILHWPCGGDELRERIEAALLAGAARPDTRGASDG